MDVPMIAEYFRQAGGRLRQGTGKQQQAIISVSDLLKFTAAVAGQVLLESSDGSVIKNMHEEIKKLKAEVEQLKKVH